MKIFDKNPTLLKSGRIPLFTVIFVGILFLLIPMAHSQNESQKPDLKFQRIYEGLISNRVPAVYQDKRGYMWMGTYSGLHRYDGLAFRVYAANSDSTSINDNYIGSIYEDSQNQLWIGTGNGMARYNWDTDDFTRFNFLTDRHVQSGESNMVNTILEDENGILWVASGGSGLYFFDRDKQEFLPFKSYGNFTLNGIAAGEGNILWLATKEAGLIKLNTANAQLDYYRHDPADPHSISSNNIGSVIIDPEGNLWAGARRSGLNRMVVDQGEVTFVRYLNEPGNPVSLHNNDIYTLYIDQKGNLWSGNENGGLHLYHKENDSFYRYLNDPKDPNSLTHNSIWSIFQDRQDRYWIGTAQSGINLADPYGSKFTHYFKNPLNPESLNNDIIRGFLETDNGNIWVATDGGGLNYYDRASGKFKIYKHDPQNPNSLRADAVVSLNKDQEGKLWACTWGGGLNILLDEQKGIFTSFNELIKNNKYPIRNVFDVHFDSNYIWVAALEEGIYRYDKNSGELRLFNTEMNEAYPASLNLPLRIFEDSRENLWIGTLAGLNVIRAKDKERVKFKSYHSSDSDPNSLAGNSIRQIMEDRNHDIWIATDRGLSRYVEKDDHFINYYQSDGLPVNEINSIVEDDHGFLWIGTSKGIAKFDPHNHVFTHYDKNDGLQGNEFSRYSVLKTRKGELLFGGMNGFNLFHPKNLISNPYAPPVYLTDLRLFNKPVSLKEAGSPLQKHISVTDTLFLPYWQNVLTFDFIALNYSLPDQNQYAYILEGFEKDWNYVGTQRNATYTNLNPGKYVFHVKAANSDGIWNEAGTSLLLVITPPFWKTDWFFVLSVLFIIGILVTGYKLRVRSIKAQNRQLERTVEERTTMLKHTNSELKKHINEKDKLLSIIGHDLRNPFISIIGYMEILEEEFESEQNTEHLENIQYLLNVSRNTHNLLENLLQWASKKVKVYEVKPELINMEKLVDTAISMVSSQAAYKKITLEKSCPDILFIYADQNMILTVMRNLISNAIKFSKQDTRIEIAVKENSAHIITSVQDYGTGMDEHALSNLFSKSNSQKPGTMGEFGTGLGLVLCQELIQKHRGRIWAESSPGKGSIFFFSLSKYELSEIAV